MEAVGLLYHQTPQTQEFKVLMSIFGSYRLDLGDQSARLDALRAVWSFGLQQLYPQKVAPTPHSML